MTDPPLAPTLPTVEVLFFDGFEELDSVGPWEVLSGAGFPIRAVGFPAGMTTVRAANGLVVGVEGPVGQRPDLLVIPGGGWLDGGAGVRPLVLDGELPSLIARLHAGGTTVASVCTGAMLLGAAGLLAGRPAVTNRLALDDLRHYGAEIHPEVRVVDDGDLLTSGGPTAGLDLGIRIVERYLGADAAAGAAARLEYERRVPILVTAPAPSR
jgi:transcriptional regulator GlxA family with amidase domain